MGTDEMTAQTKVPTPRTDAVTEYGDMAHTVPAEFARQLERELAAPACAAEPVAWRVRWLDGRDYTREYGEWSCRNYRPSVIAGQEIQPLFTAPPATPIDMVLYCPKCGLQHLDAPDERTPDWTNPPHCGDCPTKDECKEKNDCQVMRQIRHGNHWGVPQGEPIKAWEILHRAAARKEG